MKVLITYTVFHPDNYQGGSGKSFEGKALYDIPEMPSSEVKEYIYNRIRNESLVLSPFHEGFSVSILRTELF